MTQSTQFSPSKWAVTLADQYLTVKQNDPFLVKGGKYAARAVVDTFLTVAALVEMLVLGMIAAITWPLSIHHKTAEVFTSFATRTSLAANTAAHAAKGIVGYSSSKPAPEKVKKETPSLLTLERYQEISSAIAKKTKVLWENGSKYFFANSAKSDPMGVVKVVLVAAVLTGIFIYSDEISKIFKAGSIVPPVLPPPGIDQALQKTSTALNQCLNWQWLNDSSSVYTGSVPSSASLTSGPLPSLDLPAVVQNVKKAVQSTSTHFSPPLDFTAKQWQWPSDSSNVSTLSTPPTIPPVQKSLEYCYKQLTNSFTSQCPLHPIPGPMITILSNTPPATYPVGQTLQGLFNQITNSTADQCPLRLSSATNTSASPVVAHTLKDSSSRLIQSLSPRQWEWVPSHTKAVIEKTPSFIETSEKVCLNTAPTPLSSPEKFVGKIPHNMYDPPIFKRFDNCHKFTNQSSLDGWKCNFYKSNDRDLKNMPSSNPISSLLNDGLDLLLKVIPKKEIRRLV